MKPNDYVENQGEGWRVRGSRVSLGAVVSAFRDGLSPEAIARECFPTLSLEQVYGAITFYLANRAELDAGMSLENEAGEAWRQAQRSTDLGFVQKMAQARSELLSART